MTDTTVIPTKQTDITKSKNGKLRGKRRLFTRDNLDHRTKAVLDFDAIMEDLAAGVGIDRYLAEAFAGLMLNIRDLNVRVQIGEHIDIDKQIYAISSLIRLASKLKNAGAPTEAEEDEYAEDERKADERGKEVAA